MSLNLFKTLVLFSVSVPLVMASVTPLESRPLEDQLTFRPGESTHSSEGTVSTRYSALQSFSHEFGSKVASGYFVREIDQCRVTLEIAEKNGGGGKYGQTALQARLVLNPRQIAGLDSEEGHSLNFTCSTNATLLTVDSGRKDALLVVQKQVLQDNDFSEFVIP